MSVQDRRAEFEARIAEIERQREWPPFVVGLLGGMAFYAATAFPFAYITGVSGGSWGAIFMLYGVICGSVGVALANW